MLTDSVLMNLAENVGIQDMKAIALAEFGLKDAKVKNLDHANIRNPENFNFDILVPWRNRTEGSTKRVSDVV